MSDDIQVPTQRLLLSQVAYGLAACTLSASDNAMGVWFWGCQLQCPGCASPHTWSEESRHDAMLVDVHRLLNRAKDMAPGALVISGGEPSEQADGVLALAAGFKQLFPQREVVLYTGLRFAPLQRAFAPLVSAVDVVVAGPFVQSLADGQHPMAGSTNQEVVLRTALAREKYSDWRQWPAPRVQVAARALSSGTELVTVGIPRGLAQPIRWQRAAGR
jgi:anaerobic ribonucleoside-triphosphate reductase activating protein